MELPKVSLYQAWMALLNSEAVALAEIASVKKGVDSRSVGCMKTNL
jgi:hypothetical protein